MKAKKRWIFKIIYPSLILFISLLNLKFQFITIPNSEEMVERQISFITIDTVFAGFSFTALSLLMGLSSEELVNRIKNTTIIMERIQRIIVSIIYFVISVFISLYFVLGLNNVFFSSEVSRSNATAIVYVIGIGTMIVGIVYFVYCVFELYDLVKRIYNYNRGSNEQMNKAIKEAEIQKEKLKEADFCKEN